MGFSTLASAQSAMKPGGANLILSYQKNTLVGTLVVGRLASFWVDAGMPIAGTTPTAGLAGAVTTSKSDSLNFPNAASDWWLAKMELSRMTSGISTEGMYLLADRLAHANVSIVQTTGNFSPIIDGTDRLAAGEGAMIIAEITTALSAASNVFTLTYTNENGVSHTTPQITTVASAAAGTGPQNTYFYIPLADGDKGCRTITGWTLISGTATGNITIALIKPLVWAVHALNPEITALDYIIMKQGLVKVNNNACLSLYGMGIVNNTGFNGTITLIQG